MISEITGLLVQAVLVVLFILPLAACLYVPPVWDISDPNNRVDRIRVGETTRAEVLDLLGENPSVCEGFSTQTSRWYYYSGTYSAGRLAYAGGTPKSLGETPWYLNIHFNDDGIVESVDSDSPQTSTLQVSGVKFDQDVIPNARPPLPPELFLDRSCPMS
jgi:hypothetical protein